MRKGCVLGLVWCSLMSPAVWADSNFNNSSDSSVNTSGHHNSVKVNSPQVQDGFNSDASAAAFQGQQQGQLQGQAQESAQANQQSTSYHSTGQARDSVQAAPVVVLGQAQEGVGLGLPWANASVGRMSEVTKATTCGQFIASYGASEDARVQALADQCVQASRRCGVLCRVLRVLN